MKKSLIISCLILVFFFIGCSNSLSEIEGEKSAEFGSLEFCGGGDLQHSLKVSVSGFGITDKSSVLILNDISSFRIEKIPVGKNRIITIQGLDSEGNVIAIEVLKAVVDIDSGKNIIDTHTITTTSSIKGFVYSELLKNNVNISGLTETQERLLEESIPMLADCDGNFDRINYELLVNDFKNSSLSQNPQDYLLPEAQY